MEVCARSGSWVWGFRVPSSRNGWSSCVRLWACVPSTASRAKLETSILEITFPDLASSLKRQCTRKKLSETVCQQETFSRLKTHKRHQSYGNSGCIPGPPRWKDERPHLGRSWITPCSSFARLRSISLERGSIGKGQLC